MRLGLSDAPSVTDAGPGEELGSCAKQSELNPMINAAEEIKKAHRLGLKVEGLFLIWFLILGSNMDSP
jgi:hypothetical protein